MSTKVVKRKKLAKDNTNDKKSKGSIRDIDKIIEDPDAYARTVTVKRLVTILQKLSDIYYSEGSNSLVDDDIYDAMIDVLKERDPNNAFLFQTGVTKATEKDVKLPYNMPSLNKIKPGEKSLQRWFNSYNGPYIVMDKLDGISMQIYKDENGNIDLYTKKQTDIGTSKKYLLEYLIDKKTLDKIPNNTCIRGEMVISKVAFEKIKEFDTELKNERSAMSGLVNTDKIDTRIVKHAQLIVYNILSPRYTLSEQLTKLKKWGFNVVWNEQLELDDNDEDNDEEEEESTNDKILKIEQKLKNILNKRINDSDFLIDGIVIFDNSKVYEHTDDNPKYAMAFKMNSLANMKDVTVKEVEWNPTMYGYLQPKVIFDPIKMSGNVMVKQATAHNAKYVLDNKLGKGAIIKIVRSNEVIPYIVDVVKPAKKADMPEIEYEWNETNIEIIAVNPPEDIQRLIDIKKILHFYKKLGVKYLSEGSVTKLFDTGYNTIVKIAELANEKDTTTYDINGLGKTMMQKIYAEIDKAFAKIKLPELMSGSLCFGRGLGTKKIREIVKMYPSILDMKEDDTEVIAELLLNVSGFSDKLAEKFAENLFSFCEFLDELRNNTTYDLAFNLVDDKKVVKKKKKKDDVIEDMIFANQKIVMTGFRNDDITDFIERNGGQITSSVSKNTSLVIYVKNDKIQSKLEKAYELNIPVITKQEFEKKYNC